MGMNNSKWVVKSEIGDEFSIEKVLNLILKNRGIENLDDFLNPDISKIPSFKKLHDSKSAAEKIIEALKNRKKVVIYGDYDVDGISGVCLLWSFLYFELLDFLKIDKKEIEILPYIPDRVDEGYGLSEKSLDKLLKENVDLIITVDCGVRDKELIEKYDFDVIVTDHHLPPENIEENLKHILVHQLYPNKEYPFPNVCGAFVAYLLILAIRDAVGMESSFERNTQYLDLVALPTVTDIMPLHGVNRIVVKHGLELMRKGERIGLNKLAQKAQIDLENISAYHLGYLLGPRINASGRIGCAMDGLKLLATKNPLQGQEIASRLDALNFERQKLTSEILNKAREMISVKELKKLIFVYGEDWNEGIIGLVAGKLQEEFYRPVLVVTKNEGEIKGSARSVNGLNITEVIERFSEFLIKFGGHSQAAGFSVKEGMVEEFEKEIVSFVEENLESELLEKVLEIDTKLSTKDMNLELAENLCKLEPYGYGNKKPVFLLEKVLVVGKKIMGKEQNHMKLEVKGDGNDVDEAIMFNCLEAIQNIQMDDEIDLVGCIGINEWNGNRTLQFEVKEWRPCN